MAPLAASSVYLIQDVASQLYVRFTCKPSPGREPLVTARLTRRERASRFTRHSAAAECFARYLPGAAAEIVRCDS